MSEKRPPKNSWILSRKKLLQTIQKQVQRHLPKRSDEIRLYQKTYEKEFRAWKPSTKAQLMRSLAEHQIVLSGDFHAFAQSQRTHLRILRSLSIDRKVILGLECFDHRDQKFVDEFMTNRMNEDEFLKRTKWTRRWGFSWLHYKPLLSLAKERRWPVVALNDHSSSVRTLKQREQLAANIIDRLYLQNPDHMIFAIYGDLHLAQKYLPTLIQQKTLTTPLVLHQNSESIYFQLLQKGREGRVNIVSLDAHRFCIMNAAPWVKWVSYWLHLEETSDVFIEDREQIISDTFFSTTRFLARELGLRFSISDITATQGKGFHFYPETKTVVMESLQLNRIAALAGQVIAYKQGAFKRSFVMPEDFIRAIWIEALGFFMSKIFNPARPASSLSDIAREAQEIFKLCLSQRRRELRSIHGYRDVGELYRPRHRSSYELAARKLGALLGDQMFWSYRTGSIHRKVVLEWLSRDVRGLSFESLYYRDIRRLSRWSYPLKTKEERL